MTALRGQFVVDASAGSSSGHRGFTVARLIPNQLWTSYRSSPDTPSALLTHPHSGHHIAVLLTPCKVALRRRRRLPGVSCNHHVVCAAGCDAEGRAVYVGRGVSWANCGGGRVAQRACVRETTGWGASVRGKLWGDALCGVDLER